MEKKEFMTKLKILLEKRFADDEIADIVSDYESFFESGVMQGKNEAQISAELGMPIEIVNDLSKALGKKRAILPLLRTPSRVVCAVVLAIVITAHTYSLLTFRSAIHFGYEGFFVIIAVAALLWFIFGGTLRKIPGFMHRNAFNVTRLLLVSYILPFVLVAGYSIAIYVYLHNWLLNPHGPRGNIEHHAMFFSYSRAIFTITVLFVVAIATFKYKKLAEQYFPVMLHGLSAIVFFNHTFILFGAILDLDSFHASMLWTNIFYAIGLVLSVILALFAHFVQKRRMR